MHTDRHLLARSCACAPAGLLVGLVLLAFAAQTAHAGGKGAGPRLGPVARVEITLPDRAALERLTAEGYDVAKVTGDKALLYADAEEVTSLQAEGWNLTVLPVAPAPATVTPKTLGSYHNYADMTTMLDTYAADYPALCRKISLGKSVRNRDLWALKITSNPDQTLDKPKFRFMSTIHGNEPIGTENCLYFIDLLLKGYGSNDVRIVNLVDNVEIWIVPLLNPDGRESNPPQRYNANGYDLNRSFPEGSGTDMGNWLYGPSLNPSGRQPEVQAIMAWTVGHNFSLGVNFHTGSVVVNYPYDNDGLGSVFSPSPDEALFEAISLSYSSNNLPMWNSPYFTDGIVNGADWYAVSGGLQDWSYRYDGSLETTIELSDYQWPDPPASELPAYWAQNKESMLAYMEWVLKGVRGVLRDAQTGQPVTGAVRVEDYHHLVFSDPTVGDYHRILLPGTYALWFYAPGYVPQRIPSVTVGSGPATRLDVALQPVSPGFAAAINFQPSTTTLPTGYRADSGAAFGSRGNGYSYGWETTLPFAHVVERQAGRSQDLRYDTLCQMQAGGNHTWEIAVPNGPYSVLVAAGDPAFASGHYRIEAENVPLIDADPTVADRWIEGLGTVTVTDGRLTLSSGAGAVSNRLAFVEISALDPATLPQWRALWFGTIDNLGTAADDADPDQDGLRNVWEYAFGLNPVSPDQGAQPAASLVQTNGADHLACSFCRNANATDLTFSLQAAESLPAQTWTTLATFSSGAGWSGPGQVRESTPDSGRVQVTVLDPQPISAAKQRFLRLIVTHP